MTEWASRVNAFTGGWLTVLTKYGPVFLERDEYGRRLARKAGGYGVFLAKALLKLKVRDRRFREHHRTTLAMLWRSVRLRDLARGSVLGLRASLARAFRFHGKRDDRSQPLNALPSARDSVAVEIERGS